MKELSVDSSRNLRPRGAGDPKTHAQKTRMGQPAIIPFYHTRFSPPEFVVRLLFNPLSFPYARTARL